MAVHFPDHQLKIIDYNRVVKDLNGLTEAQLLEKLNAHFEVKEMPVMFIMSMIGFIWAVSGIV